jgi:RNA polymerase sigma-70 factor (ECF subfamily)
MTGPITPDELTQLIDSHAGALELFAAQWTTTAEDCVQEALVQLVRQHQRPDNVLAWLYRVVRNRAISAHRAERRRTRHEAAAAENVPLRLVSSEPIGLDAGAVAQSLALLPTELREIVVARIWGGLSFEQVAEVVSASRSTVHRRYHEALELLRTQLDETWLTKHTK